MAVANPKYQNSAGRLLAFVNSLQGNKAALELIPPIFGTGGSTKPEKQQATVVALAQIHALYVDFLEDVTNAASNGDQRKVLLTGLAGLRETMYPLNLEGAVRVPTDAEKFVVGDGRDDNSSGTVVGR